MQIEERYVKINLSGSQRKLVTDQNLREYFSTFAREHGRAIIRLEDFDKCQNDLKTLLLSIDIGKKPVLEAVIRRVDDAIASHGRTYTGK